MIDKKLLSQVQFSRSKGKVHLKYKNKQLAVIAEQVLFQLLLDAAPASFLSDLGKLSGVKTPSDEIPDSVKRMAAVYSFERLRRLGKSPSSLSDERVLELVNTYLADKKNVADFKKAILIMRNAGIKDINQFIAAQIEGLSFVNEGKGVYPKISQLATSAALDRVFNYTASSVTPTSENKTVKPKAYWFYNHVVDGAIPLNRNTKFQEVLTKIENNTASLEECIYAQKCYGARRDGKSYAKIEDHLKKISK